MSDILPTRYQGPQQIGRGGMGDIYRATDAVLGREVVVKMLADRYAQDESVRRRFTREALAAARLSGEPNTVTIFDVGEHNDRPYIVMEYFGGGSLDDVLRSEGAQLPQRVFTWLEQAGRALDAAHARGIVHRDVKPGNLLLDRESNVHVADFGIASAAGMDSLTMTGTVLGTAGYLSPEQAQGERATPASDRYALAVVAFELLTGSRPFEADSPTAEAAAHVNAPVPSISARADLPREIDRCFERALAKDPAQRFGTCAEFVAALRSAFAEAAGQTRALAAVPPTAATRTLPPPRRSSGAWPLLVGLLVAGAVAGALLAYFLTRGDSSSPTAPTTIVTHVQTLTTQGRVTTVERPVTVTTSPTTSAPPPATSGQSGVTLNNAGYAKMQAGDYAGALPLLEEAVRKLDGTGILDEAYAKYNLAYTRYHLGNCDGVLDLLDQAEAIEGRKAAIDRLREQAQQNC
ncbi:MAG: serine/threonine protein kinase [Actinobacteria bacterium]|nr:MAG: serine/threonine protein kinase [Actinomycetota bacterium]